MINPQESALIKTYNVYNFDAGTQFDVQLSLIIQPLDDYGTPIWNAITAAIDDAITATIAEGSTYNISTTTVTNS